VKPQLGFLGVGWIGRNRMECIASSGMAEIAAICDPVAAEEALRAAPEARVLPSYAALLEADLDGVVIATPSALHAEQSIEALRRGLAVFCQKPLGRDGAEVRSVVEAARTADRLLGVDLSYRYTEGMQAIKRRIAGGELGDVYSVNLVFHNAYGPDKPWFYEPKLSGGGCVMDLGIHLVDLALWSLDFPEVETVCSRLLASGKPLRPGEACEDFGVAQLLLSNGAAMQLACSWRLPAGQDCVIEASFYGTRAGATFRNVNGSFYDFEAVLLRGTAREILARPPDAWGGRAAAAWATRLASDRSFDEDCSRMTLTAETLDRIFCGR
jgi:predicted dehydrogenase